MSRPKSKKRTRAKKTEGGGRALAQAISRMEVVASGTLSIRTKICGRPNCRCAVDEGARHGPYYQWSRRSGGRQVNVVLTDEQAKTLRQAIANRREIDRLVSEWEEASAAEIMDPE